MLLLSSLFSLLVFSFDNRPSPFPGRRSQEATKLGAFLVVVVYFMLADKD